jgi:hypothetical protein
MEFTEIPGEKNIPNLHKQENSEELSPEVFRQKISDPFWLPKYEEIEKVVDSYTDEYGTFLLTKEEEDKWYAFIKNKENPVFEIWTKEYIDRFSNYLSERARLLGGTKENPIIVLEVGAGIGKLSYFLTKKLKDLKIDTIKVIATDYISTHFKINSKYNNVESLPEKDALKKYNPAIVICSWMMPEEDWTPDFRKTKSVQEYILIGPEGPTGTDETWEEWSDGFERVELEDLSEVQISRTDILYGSRKTPMIDFVTQTSSFMRVDFIQ